MARTGTAPKAAYTRLIERTTRLFRAALAARPDGEATASAIVSLCVGAMLLASTTDDRALGSSIRAAARERALALLGGEAGQVP